jgi:hypothetical protein
MVGTLALRAGGETVHSRDGPNRIDITAPILFKVQKLNSPKNLPNFVRADCKKMEAGPSARGLGCGGIQKRAELKEQEV